MEEKSRIRKAVKSGSSFRDMKWSKKGRQETVVIFYTGWLTPS